MEKQTSTQTRNPDMKVALKLDGLSTIVNDRSVDWLFESELATIRREDTTVYSKVSYDSQGRGWQD